MQHPPTTRRRIAMTLVELVAALALANFLMVAMLGVLRSFAVQRRAVIGDGSIESWRAVLRSQLEWDFANARRVSISPQQLRLVGYGGRDFETGEITHRPTEIVYDVDPESRCLWLLRHETHLDEPTLHNRRTELVCRPVAAMEITSEGETNASASTGLCAYRVRLWSKAPDPQSSNPQTSDQCLMDEVLFLRSPTP